MTQQVLSQCDTLEKFKELFTKLYDYEKFSTPWREGGVLCRGAFIRKGCTWRDMQWGDKAVHDSRHAHQRKRCCCRHRLRTVVHHAWVAHPEPCRH